MARDGFSIKTLSVGANSYPLKGIVGENRTRAIPFLSSRQGDERTRTKDTTLTRGGTGSEIIGSRITTGSEFRSKRFSSRGDNGDAGRRKENRGRADGG